jgi:hypothetical protein
MQKANDTNYSPPMALDVFVKVSGIRPDQLDGFRRWATSRKVSKLSLDEWQNLWNHFLRRPIK